MKTFTVFVILLSLLISDISHARRSGFGAVRVRSSFTKTGTYRPAHYRSRSDSFRFNNYSTRGNTNPWTGKRGYKRGY